MRLIACEAVQRPTMQFVGIESETISICMQLLLPELCLHCRGS
jgi:hypothetical protein